MRGQWHDTLGAVIIFFQGAIIAGFLLDEPWLVIGASLPGIFLETLWVKWSTSHQSAGYGVAAIFGQMVCVALAIMMLLTKE